MKHLWKNDDGTVSGMPGSHIDATIQEAIELAQDEQRFITFDFNGVTITVDAESDPSLIYRDWNRALSGYIPKKVGPRPSPALSEEEKAKDAQIEAENEARREEASLAYRIEAAAAEAKTQARLSLAPPLALKHPERWEQSKAVNTDGYGAATLLYAERLARLVQLDLSLGKDFASAIESAQDEADAGIGITGAMHGFAIGLLIQCWEHGVELMAWRRR